MVTKVPIFGVQRYNFFRYDKLKMAYFSTSLYIISVKSSLLRSNIFGFSLAFS